VKSCRCPFDPLPGKYPVRMNPGWPGPSPNKNRNLGF